MNWRRVVGLAAALAGVGAAGWAAYDHLLAPAPPPSAAVPAEPPATTLDDAGISGGVETVDVSGDASGATAGVTPMKDRVAVLGLLNKRNGQARDLTLRPGEATRVGNAVVRLRACEVTAPWEAEQYTGAFVQLDIEQSDKSWKRVHSGWLYRERPSLNVVQDPLYDVWVKSCTMSFPGSGPDTVAPPAGASRSSAPKSAAAAAKPAAADSEPTAAPSNAM